MEAKPWIHTTPDGMDSGRRNPISPGEGSPERRMGKEAECLIEVNRAFIFVQTIAGSRHALRALRDGELRC